MDVIVTAGGISKQGDPLYKYSQGKPKALLDIAGKPMVKWVMPSVRRKTWEFTKFGSQFEVIFAKKVRIPLRL